MSAIWFLLTLPLRMVRARRERRQVSRYVAAVYAADCRAYRAT